MPVYDLSDPSVPLPPQIVLDTSLLLALRPADDNPWAPAARAFVRRIEIPREIAHAPRCKGLHID